MFAHEFLRAPATHDPQRGGIDFENPVLVVQHDAVAGAFEQRAKFFLRFAQRMFRAFALASLGRDREALVDTLDLARTRIDAPEVRRYARSLENYTRDLAE